MNSLLTVTPANRPENRLAERLFEPFARMRSGVDHLLEDFPSRLSAFQFSAVPAVEMTEGDDKYSITVELPGIPAEEVDLQVDREMLILKGEKKEEREEKDRDYVISERSYGAFERRIAIPPDGQLDKIEAESNNGVLRINIPRSQDATSSKRRIEIRPAKKKS